MDELKGLFVAGILCMTTFVHHGQVILFPGLEGEDLTSEVQATYTPNITLSYAEARDSLYSQIDVVYDSVFGIYTNFGVFLTPMTDPTVTLFDAGLNTEHIYPQGRGATDGTPAHRNMHHLAAAKINVNQDRANLPFADIPDATTDKWFLEDVQMNSIPSGNIDLYSEATGLAFEPRESVKGNVARAMFYIHTIYRDQVEAVDPVFFQLQQQELCQWHFADPADEEEKIRSMKIANYQDGKENPFVIDCTLAERIYCNGIGECMVAAQEVDDEINIPLKLRYSDDLSEIMIFNTGDRPLSFSYKIYALSGQLNLTEDIDNLPREASIYLGSTLSTGQYLFEATTKKGEIFRHQFMVIK